eukprot:COSAG01_NODE_4744_length_4770_cov_93.028688_3_plen_103_part_00
MRYMAMDHSERRLLTHSCTVLNRPTAHARGGGEPFARAGAWVVPTDERVRLPACLPVSRDRPPPSRAGVPTPRPRPPPSELELLRTFGPPMADRCALARILG